jgi:hypothetical protein
MKNLIRLFAFIAVLFLINQNLNAQDVNIPDVNFKAALVENTEINTNLDTEIQVTEAEAFSGTIQLVL